VRTAVLAFFAVCAVATTACSEHVPSGAAASGAQGVPQGPPIVAPDRRRSASSSPVVFDALRGGVWTANGDVGSISYVDVDGRKLVQEIPVGVGGCGTAGVRCDVRSIALSPDGAWVAAVDRAGATVTLLDAETRQVRNVVPVGPHPRGCVWDAANPRWLYVAIEDDGSVAVIDGLLGTVADTIAVGRLPSAVGVSAQRRELYVPHRIDGALTIVDLHDRSVVAEVALGDEPFSDPKTPNGEPFAFESLALTAGERFAWLPHELLAPTHPIRFDATLFPAISVVDLLERAEATTDPNAFPPTTDGRKNLFAAIDLLGPDAQPQVFSQPCAAAMHPNGLLGWVLACASEDVLVFDVNEGVATDAVRNLPVDHPVGMTLDDTGQRLFVLGGESHTLATLDTAGGALTGHTRLYGAPIAVVNGDPLDPALRRGQTLFFRANSAKGSLATTGDDWMSCGGCHLDGFGPPAARLFEALHPSDPAKDAEIGHRGLRAGFTSRPGAATFSPHDVLVALIEQGGLAPDRSGRDRSGQVDPDCLPAGGGSAGCPADALSIATSLAAVVFRDLPAQPSWQRSTGAPDEAWDTRYCGECHRPEYEAWAASVHAHAATDPMVGACLAQERELAQEKGLSGDPLAPFCAGCHDPVNLRSGQDLASVVPRGVTCLGCHDVEGALRAGGNGDLVAAAHGDWASGADHQARAHASLELLRQPDFCGGCHRQFVPGGGLAVIGTLDEYHASGAGSTRCVDCHMRKTGGVADHRFPGGNVYLGQRIGDATLLAGQMANLAGVVQLDAKRVAGGVEVRVTNRGAAHSFPTGVTDIREAWVELQAIEGSGDAKSLVHFGGPVDGLLPPGAARLGTDIAGPDGTLLLRHEVSAATRIPFDLRVPAGEAQALFVPVPDDVATEALRAVLYYRNVRTTYYRYATGDPSGHAPDVVVAQTPVTPP